MFLNRKIENVKADYSPDKLNLFFIYFSLDHTFLLRLIRTSINEIFREFSWLENFYSENSLASSCTETVLLLSRNIHNLTLISVLLNGNIFVIYGC
jgi:hypothetical protein